MDTILGNRIFFMGVTEFGLVCFNQLREMGCNIIGCTYTDREIYVRGQKKGIVNSMYVDFNEIAKENNIAGVYFNKFDPAEFEQSLIKMNPDLIVVAGFHYLINTRIIKIPQLSTVGLHSSILPKYRGGSPLVWQIINGESKSGLTLFYIDEKTDTGDIIGQELFCINETDTIKELLFKSKQAAVKLLGTYIPMILSGGAPRWKQNEMEATYYRQRTPSDGEINWTDTPENIKNFIRAQTKPYPGAFTNINGKKVIIWDADIIS